jgi:hypothetical protein
MAADVALAPTPGAHSKFLKLVHFNEFTSQTTLDLIRAQEASF